MARTGVFHHVGTFLLFVSAILILITTISAPVVNDIAILRVDLTANTDGKHQAVTFGTFGYCQLDVGGANTDHDSCTKKHIGYNPAAVMAQIDNTNFNLASEDTTKALTRVMILHPIACGLAFISFLIALGAGMFGSIFAAVLSAITLIITIVVLATDLVLFGLIKKHVDHDGSGSRSHYGAGLWTLVAALVTLFFGAIIVLFSCCSSRLHKDHPTKGTEAGYTTQRRHFWQRRNRY